MFMIVLLKDGKVSSATLPGAGAQVASDHHLGKAGRLATQVLRRFRFFSPHVKSILFKIQKLEMLTRNTLQGSH